mmetsp:Transcript_150138/g.279936  ORF Transcript_150138/g.279936 Transcript_150138/m.279936 type:complete len:87 (-) Transcript_150138:720-980(-)
MDCLRNSLTSKSELSAGGRRPSSKLDTTREDGKPCSAARKCKSHHLCAELTGCSKFETALLEMNLNGLERPTDPAIHGQSGFLMVG